MPKVPATPTRTAPIPDASKKASQENLREWDDNKPGRIDLTPTDGPPNATTIPKSKKKRSPKTSPAHDTSRPVIYEKRSVKVCEGDKSLTSDQAKKLLGWTQETEQAKFNSDYLLKDWTGNKVRCFNNINNRPLYSTVWQTLMQEILRRRWRFNGEPIIIGKTGLILNGQHTLVALAMAAQEWELNKDRWADYWPTEPTLEKLVVFGVDEDDAVVNTMDTCKPRSLADVIYRSEFFVDMSSKDRRQVARIADYAVRMLWHRTGAGMDAFAPRRTHAESLDFINRHPKILECIKHVYIENGEENLSPLLSLGYLSALMYLMGSCKTDRENEEKSGYSQVSAPSETQLNWDMWDLANDYLVLLASGNNDVKPVRKAIADVAANGLGSITARCALLIKGWNVFSCGDTISPDDLALSWVEHEDGSKVLTECPIVGGIDLGDAK